MKKKYEWQFSSKDVIPKRQFHMIELGIICLHLPITLYSLQWDWICFPTFSPISDFRSIFSSHETRNHSLCIYLQITTVKGCDFVQGKGSEIRGGQGLWIHSEQGLWINKGQGVSLPKGPGSWLRTRQGLWLFKRQDMHIMGFHARETNVTTIKVYRVGIFCWQSKNSV